MENNPGHEEKFSPWWKNAVILVLIFGFSILVWLAVRSYKDAPPIADAIVDTSGNTIFTGDDIRSGQEVFLKYGLMQNGTVWGHGAYLGPDYSARYLHQQTLDSYDFLAQQKYGTDWAAVTTEQKDIILAEVARETRINTYDPVANTLTLNDMQTFSFERQQEEWRHFFSEPAHNFGLPDTYINDETELRQLVAFFFWTSWASSTNRPGKDFSYTTISPITLK